MEAGAARLLDDVKRAVPGAAYDGAAAEVDHRRARQFALEDREHEPAVLLVERADRIVEHDPARPLQQQARECQTLLLVEGQLVVPALGAIEQGHQMAEIDPLQRRAHRGIVEPLRPVRIAHGGAQRAERQIRPLRHEHHLVAGR